jgi:hypothetical protein
MFARLSLLVAVVLCLAVAPAASAATTPQSFGFNDNAASWGVIPAAADAALASRAGATVHRLVFDWRWAQRTPTDWRLGTYDTIYSADLAAGIRPIFILFAAPQWTWASGTPCVQATQDCRYPPGPTHLDAWRNVVQVLVRRYPKLAGLEIWNEPNLTIFWQSGPDPAYYTTLVKEAHGAVRAVHSNVPVIGGSLSNYPGPDGSTGMSSASFLAAMYAAGMKGQMDGLSVHPYPSDIDEWRFYKTLTEVREIRDANGDATPLWITELGITTSGSGPPQTLSENDQAVLFTRLLARLRAMPDVRTVVVHTLLEPTQFGWNSPERGYGVLRPDLTPKPAYCALAAANGTGYVCPADVAPAVPDPTQVARWQAQDLLQEAADAARAYRRQHGAYAGLDSPALHAIDPALSDQPAVGDLAPGGQADPSRIGVWVWTTSLGETLLLCNTSRADRSYCIETIYRKSWTYAHADGSVYAAAGALNYGYSQTW